MRAFRSLFVLTLACVGTVEYSVARNQETSLEEGQEQVDAQQRTLERFQRYLDHNPFHEGGFERLVEAAVAVNGLGDLVQGYASRVEADDPERSTRIVLARLYARTEREEDALGILSSIAEEDAERGDAIDAHLAHLLGRLALDERRIPEAVRALDTAASATTDARLLERIHADRGAAHLAAGNREDAVSAFRDLARLDPGSFHLRLAAAEALATNGLVEEALEEYATAIDLVADDVPRRCRALSESGRLLERLDRPAEALAAYDLALDLLGRGHWLKRDLFMRVLALHTRAGTLADLVRDVRARVAADPADLDRRELLADALEGIRDLAGARAVLEEATRDFEGDLRLGRHLLEVLERTGDVGARIAEYQRQIERHPDELDLYLELGQAFASEGRLEQARRQWDRSLESRLSDPGLCVRLAGLYALYDMYEQAERMLERAIELQPGDLGHFGEMADVLVRANRREELPALLERARLSAGEDRSRLELLADLARGLRHTDVARSALEAALELDPGDPQLLRSLADVCVEERDFDGAAEHLQAILSVAENDANARRDAAVRLIRLFRSRDMLPELTQRQDEILRADSADLGALYVLAKIDVVRHRRASAVEHLELLLEQNPEDVVAAVDYARLQLELGDDAAAISQYRTLMEQRPGLRATYLKEIARIHAEQGRDKEALACYEEVLELSPDNPATFADVAGRYRALGEDTLAAECLRQALRLRPDDGRYRMELAAVYTELDLEERAEREVLAAVKSEDEAVRGRARAWLHERLVENDSVDEEIARLRERLAANPYDNELTLALVDLFVRELEYELALDLIGDLLTYRPETVSLLRQRADLEVEMERWERARDDYESLQRLPDVNREDLNYSLARCALELGDKARADRLLLGARDPLRVAALYTRFGLHRQATAAIEKALTLVPDDRVLLDRLVRLSEGRGDLEAALAAHDRRIDLDGEDWDLMVRRAELLVAVGRTDELVAGTLRMLDTLEVPAELEGGSRIARRRRLRSSRSAYRKKLNELRTFYMERGLNAEFAELMRERLLAAPADEDLFKITLSAIQWSTSEQGMIRMMTLGVPVPRAEGDADGAGPLALETLVAVRAGTLDAERFPAGHDAKSWRRILDRAEQTLYRTHPVLTALRTEELGRVGTAGLSLNQLNERIDLLVKQGQSAELLSVLEEAHVAHPDKTEYLAGLAIQLYESRAAEADMRLAELVKELEASPGTLRNRRDDDDGAHERHMKRILKKLPDELREQVDELLEVSLYRLSRNNPLREGWKVGRTPDHLTARLVWGRCLAERDLLDEARAVLAVLEPTSPEFMDWTASMAEIYWSLGFEPEARRLDEALFEVVRRVQSHPVLAHGRRWRTGVRGVMSRAARRLEREGRLAEAHELLRCWSGPGEARVMVSVHDAAELLTAHYTQALADARAKGDAGAARRQGILLAEILTDAEEWGKAADIYQEMVEADDGDDSLVTALAATFERAGQRREAIALHRNAMQRKLKRFEETGEVPPVSLGAMSFNDEEIPTDPSHLVPDAIASGSSNDQELFSELAQARFYGSFGSSGTQAKGPDLSEHWSEIFRIAFLDEDYGTAGEAFSELHAISSNITSFVTYELESALTSRRVGKEAVELWRVLYEIRSGDSDLVLGYGKALVALDREQEARRIYKKFVRGNASSDDWGIGQVRQALTAISPEAEVVVEETEPLDLESAVAADPKNVRLRLSLVHWLLEERRFELACETALETERLAPHLEEVRELARDTLVLVGRDAEYEERLARTLESSNDVRERLVAAVRLADLAWERGDEEAVNAFFALADRGGQLASADLSLASWWLNRGRYAEARALLEEDVKRQRMQSWRHQQLQSNIAYLSSLEGDPMLSIDSVWSGALESSGRIITPELYMALLGAIAQMPDLDAAAEAIEAAAEKHGGARGELYRAALDFSRGRAEEAEERLVNLALADASAKMLLPYVVGAARSREEWSRARSYLERLDEVYPTNDRRRMESPIGELGERQSLLVELGSLMALEGDPERAKELWTEAFERDPDGSRHTAQMLARHGMFEEAGEALHEHLERSGGREVDDLLLMISIDRALGRTDEVIRGLKLAHELESAKNERDNSQLQAFDRVQREAYRSAGRLEELRAKARENLRRDSSDSRSAALLINLTLELDGPEAVGELVDGGEIDASFLYGVQVWLAGRAWNAGDLERAARLYGAALEATSGGRQHVSHARDLARVLRQIGRDDEAVLALRRLADDPESADGWRGAASLLANQGDWERVLECLDAALAVGKDPENDPWGRRARALLEMGRASEAAEVFFNGTEAVDSRANRISDTLVARLSRETDADERTREQLAQTPDDPALLLRAALFARADGDYERAVVHLEALLAERLDDPPVEELLWRSLVESGEHARAIAVLEKRIDLLDREQVLVDGQNYSQAHELTSMRAARGEILLRSVGSAAAIEAWTDRLGLRFKPIDPDMYSVGFFRGSSDDGTLVAHLWTYGLFEELLAAAERNAAPRNGRSRSESRPMVAMFRSGRRAEALDRLWDQAFVGDLPEQSGMGSFLSGLGYASGVMYARLLSSGQRFYGESGGDLQALVRLSVEDGRAEDLERRLWEQLESRDQEPVREALGLLQNILGRPQESFALMKRDWDEDNPTADQLASFARSAYRAGAFAEAYDALVRQRAVNQPLLELDRRRRELPYLDGPGEPVRFQFGMRSDMGIFFSSGGGFSYYNDGGGFEGVSQSLVDPDLWIAVLHATGRKREALTAEKAELLRLWNRGSEQPEADLARSLASLDRFDAAQRLAELHIGEQVDESASPLCADLVSAAHRLGRDVDCERWIANHLSARAAEDVIDSPGRRWSQALFLAKNGGAAELVDAEVRRARELDPKGRHEPSEGDRGWIALATGDAAAASRHFVAGLEEQRLAGRRLEDDAQALRFGLGLALAASEDLDAARPVLLRALAELPNDPFAPRARAVLGL